MESSAEKARIFPGAFMGVPEAKETTPSGALFPPWKCKYFSPGEISMYKMKGNQYTTSPEALFFPISQISTAG